jgi:hypothetical protein
VAEPEAQLVAGARRGGGVEVGLDEAGGASGGGRGLAPRQGMEMDAQAGRGVPVEAEVEPAEAGAVLLAGRVGAGGEAAEAPLAPGRLAGDAGAARERLAEEDDPLLGRAVLRVGRRGRGERDGEDGQGAKARDHVGRQGYRPPRPASGSLPGPSAPGRSTIASGAKAFAPRGGM